MTSPVRPKAREDLALVELDGEAVIYDEREGNVHHLNSTATLVFTLCDGTTTIPELARDLAEAYGEPEGELEGQIRSLLLEFKKTGLLDGHGGAVRG